MIVEEKEHIKKMYKKNKTHCLNLLHFSFII